MEENNIYREIAKKLERVRLSTDDVVITFDEDEVKITAGESYMICGYMMRRISVVTNEFEKKYFVHLSIDNKPEVIIYD